MHSSSRHCLQLTEVIIHNQSFIVQMTIIQRIINVIINITSLFRYNAHLLYNKHFFGHIITHTMIDKSIPCCTIYKLKEASPIFCGLYFHSFGPETTLIGKYRFFPTICFHYTNNWKFVHCTYSHVFTILNKVILLSTTKNNDSKMHYYPCFVS